MNKKVLLLAGSLSLAASAFALDFGGSLGNYTKLGTPAHPAEEQFKSINLKQEGIFTGWVRHNFNQNSFITAEADFRVRYQDGDLKDSADGKVHYIPDVKQFRFFNKFDTSRGPVSFNLGRFAFNDLQVL